METKSYIEDIVKYLRKNLDKGYHLDDLRIQLRKQGYSMSAITRGVEVIEKEMKDKQIIITETKEKEQIEMIEEPNESKVKGFFNKIGKIFKT